MPDRQAPGGDIELEGGLLTARHAQPHCGHYMIIRIRNRQQSFILIIISNTELARVLCLRKRKLDLCGEFCSGGCLVST